MPLTFECTGSPAASDLAVVDAGIDQYNLAEPEIHNVRPLSVFVRDDAGSVQGGAVGRTWGQCCELRQLWIAQEARRQGLGTALMALFEREACARGCSLVYLDTFTFQARPFYERLGYSVALATPGFTNGIVKYTMHKRLASVSN